MKKAALLALVLASAACGKKLEGTWKGQFEKDTVTFEFAPGDKVKCTWTRNWASGEPIRTSSDMSYSIENDVVYFKGAKVTNKARLEDGNLVGTPADLGFENLDSTKRVVVKREP